METELSGSAARVRVFLDDHKRLLSFLEEQKFWLEQGEARRARKCFRDFQKLLVAHHGREGRFFKALLSTLDDRLRRQMRYAEEEHERVDELEAATVKAYERYEREGQRDDTLLYLARRLQDVYDHHCLREERYFYKT